MFSFGWPWAFLLLPLPLVVYWFTRPVKKEQAAVVVPFYQQLLSIKQKPISLQAQHLQKGWLLVLVLIWFLWVSAAARPQWTGEPIAVSTSGRDLLLAVDISDSMDQADMEISGNAITRLQSVKIVVNEFIKRRQGDRIGLVLFGTNAYLQAPLTFDTKTVAQLLQEAQLGFAGPRTAIGDAIGLSVKRLQNLKNANDNKVLILLTDGANTAGKIDPLQAATLAKQTDVKIYTIGIGADEMTIRSFFGPRVINPSAQLDEETLINIADSTGGRYFRARETSELEKIYQLLDQLEPIDQEKEWLRPIQSLYIWPLSIALALSIICILLRLFPLSFAIEKINEHKESKKNGLV